MDVWNPENGHLSRMTSSGGLFRTTFGVAESPGGVLDTEGAPGWSGTYYPAFKEAYAWTVWGSLRKPETMRAHRGRRAGGW